MRQILISSIILLSSYSRAQKNVFSLKPTLGITACQVHGDAYSGFHKLGFTGGFYIDAPLSEKVSAELGIIFIQKGARKNPNPNAKPYPDYTAYYLTLNYFEIPLLFRYNSSKFFLTFGASYGYLSSYYEATELGNITGYAPFLKDEYSFNIGAGMKFGKKMDIEIRSNNSFKTIRPWKIKSNVYYPNWIARKFSNGLYNNILEIIFSYRIDLKKRTTSGSEEE